MSLSEPACAVHRGRRCALVHQAHAASVQGSCWSGCGEAGMPRAARMRCLTGGGGSPRNTARCALLPGRVPNSNAASMVAACNSHRPLGPSSPSWRPAEARACSTMPRRERLCHAPPPKRLLLRLPLLLLLPPPPPVAAAPPLAASICMFIGLGGCPGKMQGLAPAAAAVAAQLVAVRWGSPHPHRRSRLKGWVW